MCVGCLLVIQAGGSGNADRQKGATRSSIVDVVRVVYSKDTVSGGIAYTKAFGAPPAESVPCLNPAFA